MEFDLSIVLHTIFSRNRHRSPFLQFRITLYAGIQQDLCACRLFIVILYRESIRGEYAAAVGVAAQLFGNLNLSSHCVPHTVHTSPLSWCAVRCRKSTADVLAPVTASSCWRDGTSVHNKQMSLRVSRGS